MQKAMLLLMVTIVTIGSVVAQPVGPFREELGLVVIEAERANLVDQWRMENSVSGFTGDGYIFWTGNNHFNDEGIAILAYEILITNPGEYRMELHNHHNGHAFDADNDVWVRIDGGEWEKVFSNLGSSTQNRWNWDTRVDKHGNFPAWIKNLGEGLHTLELSARSQNFRIDRIHLCQDGVFSEDSCESLDLPESQSKPTNWEIDFTSPDFMGFAPVTSDVMQSPVFDKSNRGLCIIGHAGMPGPGFGAWSGFVREMTLEGGREYEVLFTLSSDATDAARLSMPTIRLRANTESFQFGIVQSIEPVASASYTVTNAGRQYRMLFKAPHEVHGEQLLLSMDWLFLAGPGKNASMPVYLQRIDVQQRPQR